MDKRQAIGEAVIMIEDHNYVEDRMKWSEAAERAKEKF